MAKVIRSSRPLPLSDHPGPLPLRRQLRRCACGCLTFLNLPCRRCGRRWMQPEFDRARRCGAKRLARLVAGMLACTLAAMWLVAQVWPWLAVLPVVVLLVVAATEWSDDGLSLYETFFLFHPWKRVYARDKLTAADAESLFQLQQAYDGDLRRLEQMLDGCREQEDRAARAEEIFCLGRQLAEIYHNRRLSALLAGCLLLMQPEEGIRVDLEQVCRYLCPQDLLQMANEGRLLDWLDSWVKASCLPAGQYTARTLVRICGLRVEKTMAECAPLLSGSRIVEADRCSGSFTQLEISKMQAIWLSCGFADRCLDEKSAAMDGWKKGDRADRLELGISRLQKEHLAAQYWSDVCWYEEQSTARQSFLELLGQCGNRQEKELLDSWGKEAAQ